MEITGKIILAFPEVSGTSQAGKAWKKREYVLETLDNYPQKIFFDFFGERADQYPLSVGQVIRLSFDISSREYNGRWFTSIRGWRAEDVNNGASNTENPANTINVDIPVIPPIEIAPSSEEDDLPF